MTSYNPKDMGVLEPQERLKALTSYSSSVEVDPSVPPRRYYRSGLEMVRMANVYFEEGSLENAYVLYLKFMTLFLEKIRKHPEYNTVPATDKTNNQDKLREVLPKAEKLKKMLLEQFTKEYNRHIAERQKEEQEQKRRQQEEKQRVKNRSIASGSSDLWSPTKAMVVQPFPDLNNISYPDSTIPSAPPEPILPPSVKSKSDIPTIDRSSKPSAFDERQSSLVKADLRTVIVPAKVMTHFLNLAQVNTFKNIETCGILAGKLERNKLIITHVILPKQKGTSDSCVTMNEEEIFDYQDTHNLITIGWIHTHPTQTAFLSSVDLHTHCPYQMLMPEAIAIVCAPKYNETGFFILTPNYGLQYIANCKKTGFHPHPTEPALFMHAEHINVDDHSPLEVLDLR